VLDGSDWSLSRSGRFTTAETVPDTHWIGGRVGPKVGLEAVENREYHVTDGESNPYLFSLKAVASAAGARLTCSMRNRLVVSEMAFGWIKTYKTSEVCIYFVHVIKENITTVGYSNPKHLSSSLVSR
jgi:hypothetical protein